MKIKVENFNKIAREKISQNERYINNDIVNEIIGEYYNRYEIKTTYKYLTIEKLLGSHYSFTTQLVEYLVNNSIAFKLDYNFEEIKFTIDIKSLQDIDLYSSYEISNIIDIIVENIL